MEATFKTALSWADRNTILSAGQSAYQLNNEEKTTAETLNVVVGLKPLFEAFYAINPEEGFDALWIQPGLNENSQIILIIGFMKKETGLTEAYYILDGAEYMNELPEKKDKAFAQNIFDAYWGGILIHNKKQSNNVFDKKGRFLEWGQLLDMCTAIGNFSEENLESLEGYSLKFETGFITLEMSANLWESFGEVMPYDLSVDYCSGYTPLCYLKNPEGENIIDENAQRSILTYRYRVLGFHPTCPPKCAV